MADPEDNCPAEFFFAGDGGVSGACSFFAPPVEYLPAFAINSWGKVGNFYSMYSAHLGLMYPCHCKESL